MDLSLLSLLVLLCTSFPLTQAQTINQLATHCHPNTTAVVCIQSHAAVLPEPFFRAIARDGTLDPLDTFQNTTVPEDPTFDLTHNASFLIFNKTLGLSLLGPAPTLTKLFDLDAYVHEAPVFIPSENRIIFSEFGYGVVSQYQINLSTDPPTLSPYKPQTPVLGINGGTLHRGLIYRAVSGSKPLFLNNTQIPGLSPGIYALNTTTATIKPIVNNYYGTPLNSPNDLTFSSCNDLFFTDSIYGYQQNITLHAPALPISTYRFRPRTGELSIIESSLIQPNGIAFSPDEKTLYIGDSGAGYTTIYLPEGEVIPPLAFNATGQRSVFAFDVRETEGGKVIVGKRAVYLAQEGVPDGLKVSREGYVVVRRGRGGSSIVFPSSLSRLPQLLVTLSRLRVLERPVRLDGSPP